MTALGGVLPDPHESRGIPWHRLVGRTLAGETVAIGVDDRGRLRVMAHNETGCREVLARQEHVLSAWNAWASEACERLADELVCWVRRVPEGEAPRSQPLTSSSLTSSPLSASPRAGRPDDPAQAEDPELTRLRPRAASIIGDGVVDPALAEALIAACSRALREADQKEHGGQT